MKKIFSLVAAALISMSAFAQVSTTLISHNNGDDAKWSINLLGLTTVNNEKTTSVDFNFHRDYTDSCTPGFYFGLSNMSTDDFGLKPGGSLEFGFTPIDFAWWNNHHNIGIISGIGVSWTRYAFKNNEAIVNLGSSNLGSEQFKVVSLDHTGNSNPRMTYASWRLPIELAVYSNRCLFTAGIEGELRHHLRMRTKYEDPISGKVTKRHHYVTMHEMGVNPWGVNAVASIGCNGVSVYGRMALTEFFNSDETNLTGTPFMVGIRFYNF